MAEGNMAKVPLAVVIVGGLVVGAGLFGAFRGMNAQPLPLVESKDEDPFGALQSPTLPPAETSPLPAAPPPAPTQQAGAIVPELTTPLPLLRLPTADGKSELPTPVPPASDPAPLPPVLPTDTLPKPVELPPAPKATDPLPPPALNPAPLPLLVPKPDPVPAPVTLPPATVDPIPGPETAPETPKPADPLPLPSEIAPVSPKVDPVTPPVESLPKPVEIPQSVTPSVSPTDPEPVKPENDLRPDSGTLTVNPRSAPASPETLPVPRKVGDETLPPPRSVVEERVPPMPEPVVEPTAAPFTPGSTPMTPVSRHTLLTAVMGAALAAAPAYTQEPAANAEAIKTLQTQIAEMKKDITFLKEERNALNKQLNGIADSPRKTPEEKGVLLRLQEAEAAATKMTEKVDQLEKQLAQKTVSEKVPVGGADGSTITPGRGVVKLVNEYNVKVSMMVNGVSYPLAINEVKQVEVPVGKLTYELVEFPNASAKETTIKEGETVTLRIK